MLEEPAGFLGAERRDRRPEGLKQGFAATRLSFAHQPLDLAEGLLYGVEIRRVGRQVEKLAAPPFDELPYLLPFVGRDRLSITTT